MKAKTLVKTVSTINPKLTVALLTVLLLTTAFNGITHADDPEFPSDTAAYEIKENVPIGTLIARVTATDTDRDRLTYQLNDADSDTADARFFTVDENTGRLRLKQTLNFEMPRGEDPSGTNTNEYVVTIKVADDEDFADGNNDEITVTITVIDVNEAPVFADETPNEPATRVATRTIPEKTLKGIDIGTPVSLTDPDALDDETDTNPQTVRVDTLIYTLTGPDARHFEIDPSAGQLKTKTVFNFEAPMDTGGTPRDNFYIVTVIATDSPSGGLSTRVTVPISVTDVNEAPEFPSPTASRSIPENAPAGTTVGTPITATDPDGDTLTYSVGATVPFVIESDGQLKTKEPLDYETQNSHTIAVTVMDDDDTPLSNNIVVTITLTDQNDEPMFTQTTAPTLSVPENQRAGPFDNAVRATDLDGDTLTYTVVDIPGNDYARLFAVDNNGQLRTRQALDFEAEDYPTGGYMVRLTVSDRKPDAAIDDTIDVTITVTNVNEPPAFPYDTARNRLYVYDGGTTVYDPDGEVMATDPDSGTTLNYTLSGPDASSFTPDTVPLALTAAADYEGSPAKRTYTVTVQVSDGALSDFITVTIRVIDVADDTGVNQQAPTFVDEDGDNLPGPVSFSVDENSRERLIGRVRAIDRNNDTLTYTITGGDTNNLFDINNTGRLYSKEPLDHEAATGGAYTVTVTVTDGVSANTDTIDVTITVIDLNEAPVFGTLDMPIMRAARAVAENQPSGTDVGTTSPLPAADPEGDPLTFTLSGTDADSFTIEYSGTESGQLKTAVALDYEAKPIHNVMVTVSDGELSATIPVTITVTDRNDPPMFSDGDQIEIPLPENTGDGVKIGMPVTATDQDGDTLTYDFADTNSPNSASFSLSTQFGQLSTATGTNALTLDYEGVEAGSQPFYQIAITVTDSKTPEGTDDTAIDDTIIVTFVVTDINEPPTFSTASSSAVTIADGLNVPENTMAGHPIDGRILATDPEQDALTYSLANARGSTDANSFDINATTGQLRVKAPLDYEKKRTYTVMVRITDNQNGMGRPVEQPITITVIDVNEPSMFTEGDAAARSIPEQTTGTEAVNIGAPIVATDPEMNAATPDTLTYGLARESTLFSIDSTGQLMLRANQVLNYEGTGGMPPMHPYTLVVTVNDGVPNADTIDDRITVTVTVIDVNEPPVFPTETTGAYVYTGTAAGRKVYDPNGVLKATDPDAGDRLTYLLSGTGAARFSINNSGALTTKAVTLAAGSETVEITATDSYGREAMRTSTITVYTAPETPTFPSAETGRRSIDENAVATTTAPTAGNVGTPVAATQVNLTYTLGGTHAASFSIDSTTGQLSVKAPLDHEVQSSYTVTVTAANDTHTADQPVTITVNNIEEQPMFNEGTETTRMVPENTPAGRNVGSPLTATDSDRHGLTYALGTTGGNEAMFDIDASNGQLITKDALDYERTGGPSLTVQVFVDDGRDADSTVETLPITVNDTFITVTIMIEDRNDDPMFVADAAATPPVPITTAVRSIAENAQKGVNIGTPVPVFDADGDTLSYMLRGDDAASFDIEPTSGQLIVKAPLDYEAEPLKRSYDVVVRVVDGNGGSDEVPVTIEVDPANDPPMFAKRRVELEVAENAANADVGAPVIAADKEADASVADTNIVTYALSGPDASFFSTTVTDGQIQTGATALDFENPDHDPTYEVYLTATDSGGATDQTIVMITVTDVNEPPTFLFTGTEEGTAANPIARSIAEGTGVRPIFPAVLATDPEGDTVTYTFKTDRPAATKDDYKSFSIDNNGMLMTKMALDHETKDSYTVTLIADSGHKTKPSADVTITVLDVQEPPMFTEGETTTRTVQETDTGVMQFPVIAIDEDDEDTRTYYLKNPGAAPFSIAPTTGTLSIVGDLDYETVRSYMVTVRAVDTNARFDEIRVTINVADVEEEPMFAEVTPDLFVYEGASGQPVYDPTGALMATDGDGDALTYTLKSGAASFSISHTTGRLTTATALDYETDSTTYMVDVTVSDGTHSIDKRFTIDLRDVTEEGNEPPVFVDAEGNTITQTRFEVVENSADSIIGTVRATDPNQGDQVAYTLSGRDARYFSVGSDNGILESQEPLDFDTRPGGYRVTITATDGQVTATLQVTVNVTNVNEAPMFVDESDNPIPSTSFEIPENRSGNIGVVRATDPDGDVLTYTLDAVSQAHFSVRRTSGGVQLSARQALDHEMDASHTVTIDVRDSKDDDGNTDTATDDTITVTVTVLDVNEVPRFVKTDGSPITRTRMVPENSAGGTEVGEPVVASDPERDSLTYSLRNANTASVPFQIDETSGQLTTTASLDHETQSSYSVTVYASDQRDARGMAVADGVADIDASVVIQIAVEDVDETTNQPPVFVDTEGNTITSATRTVKENAANANVGLPVEARDPDLTDTSLTYGISGTDAGFFTINENTGQLMTSADGLNYEADRNEDENVTSADFTYEVIVTATDPGRPSETPPGPMLSTTIPVTITVEDVNEAPEFLTTTGDVYVYEGDAGQKVFDHNGRLTAKDPDSGDTLTYRLDANSQRIFARDANTGMLTTKVALDYDGDPAPIRSYTVTVTATDAAGEAASTSVSIALKDVTGDETGETNTAPRFIASEATKDTAIASAAREIMEGMALERDVGAVILATDDDEGDTLTYRLSGADAASFTVEKVATGAQLKTAVPLEFDGSEAKRTYTVMLTVSDGNTADDATVTVTVTVTNDVSDDAAANNQPSFATESTSRSIIEGTGVRAITPAVEATDTDGDDLTYSLTGPDAASFTIDAATGLLSTTGALDYETRNAYTVTVNVSDSKDDDGEADTGIDDSITVNITIENDPSDDPTGQNRPPTFTAGTSTTRSVSAGGAGRNVGARIAATDLDNDTLIYALSGGHTALFAINSNTGQLTTRASVTAGSYSVTVTVHDGKAPDGSASTAIDDRITVSIRVTAPGTTPDPGGGQPPAPQPLPDTGGGQQPIPVTNDPPTFDDGTSATRSVAENTAAGTNIGAPVGATDPNNDPLTYTLGGADAASFGINSTSGQLMTSAALDFEVKRVYTVVVTADDGLTGGTAAITVTINVTDVSVADGDPEPTNNAPAFASDTAARSVAENTAAGMPIGAPVAAVDTDAGEVLTYTLGGTDMASFDINGATGQLMTQAALDHETKDSYTVMVTATDKGGLTDSITVEITVTDVNEAPAFADATAARSVDENTAAGMNIGAAFTATDPDDGDEVMYSLGGTDMASFAIGDTTGQLMTMGMLDHETKDSYTVMVIATDSGGLTGSITVTISVMDVNDAPMFASATATRMVEENTAAGMAIGDPVMATDDDGDDITYSLGGVDMASFAIDTATGQLKTMADLDYEAQASHTVMVTASDGTLMSSVTVTITVTDVPEFMLSVPAGQSLIHVPLKMAGLAKISDLYDKLGGATNVNLLITYDASSQRWLSYIGEQNRGRASDRDLTDDLGILADMKNAVTLQLSGDALGTDGTASITLVTGSNLVGVPLKDSRITNVSDLLELDDNVSFIIVSDGGEYKTITRAGDPGDVAVTGGQSFILNATAATTVSIMGDGWASSAMPAAPWLGQTGIHKTGVTSAVAVTGSVVDGVKGLTDFHITVKNLSTGQVETVATDKNGTGYQLTVVDVSTGRAAQVGDILEITAQSTDPLVGVEPLRYVVTAEDVKRSHIQLDALVTYEIPAKTELLRNYPNPFNPETWIPYRLATDAVVTLRIYNQKGEQVRSIPLGHQVAAVYETRHKAIYWDGRNDLGERVASGIYFYHLTAGDYTATRKMVIVK
ncbi:hypothetical protein C6499_19315 [Candidatus Poribacteria bacterium]|nr:MAG: hypothetical protein C6499_19315 [Candidatus Poribacteria bacterium]